MTDPVPQRWEATTTAALIREKALLIGDGYRAKNSEFVDGGGLPFIRVGDITSRIRTDVRDELPLSRVEHYEPKVSQTNDSLITMKGTVGRVARVSSTTRRFVYSPQISFWRVRDPSRLDPHFLSYWLRSPAFAEQAFATKSATDMADYINLRDQRRMSLLLPPLATQQRVAAILSAFDELIEINERRIELLEDLARSLYREWFVRFRFPGHMEAEFMDSELGSIPERWAVRRLGDVASLNKRIFRAIDLPDPLRYLDISSVGVGRLNEPTVIEAARAPGRARRSLRDGDVLFATVRPNRRAHGLVHDPPPDLVASTGLAAMSPESVPASFLFLHVSHPAFTEYLVSRATGSAYPAVRPIDFEQAPIVVPSASILGAFDPVAAPSLRLANALVEQNRALARGRDLLLPRLVTGRLDISDVDLGDLLVPEAA